MATQDDVSENRIQRFLPLTKPSTLPACPPAANLGPTGAHLGPPGAHLGPPGVHLGPYTAYMSPI